MRKMPLESSSFLFLASVEMEASNEEASSQQELGISTTKKQYTTSTGHGQYLQQAVKY